MSSPALNHINALGGYPDAGDDQRPLTRSACPEDEEKRPPSWDEKVEVCENADMTIEQMVSDLRSDLQDPRAFTITMKGGRYTLDLTEWGRASIRDHLVERIYDAITEERR